jgi:hypothetical protein
MLAGFITEAAQILVEDNDGSRYTLEDLSKSAKSHSRKVELHRGDQQSAEDYCQTVRQNRNSSASHPSCRLSAAGGSGDTTAQDTVVKRVGRVSQVHGGKVSVSL